ncbi:putative low choriolytic enzyme-like [Penaeus vannamei]|uniref:Metalloendopeptidase n=1 Tax=Penaeus vannamei TaxID=6689 RepID=A0A423TLI1_PENVA|nr:putative low choriolytic enzyme-like [Penaeus vannamei]
MHEILHAAGFLHEHTRPDRGTYIQVKWKNIREDARRTTGSTFGHSSLDVPTTTNPLMHYGRYTFSEVSACRASKAMVTRRRPTLVPKLPVAGGLGGSSLTPLDIRRVNTFYKCV